MKFLTKLVETESSVRLREVQKETGNDAGEGLRDFHHIEMGNNIRLSIQASKTHYCTPQETIDIEKYTHMELMIIRRQTYLTICDISDDPVLITKLRTCVSFSIPGANIAYKNVPVEWIEEVYQLLKE